MASDDAIKTGNDRRSFELTASITSDLVKIFADPIFDLPADLSPSQRYALVYRRLQHIHARLDLSEPLLHDRPGLTRLLELAAMVDPGLFHVMFLHHCMTIGAAIDYGADDDDIAELCSGRSIGAALMTELGQGNSSADIRTEAVYDQQRREFILDTPGPGAAKYPPNVGLDGVPRLAVVSARLRAGAADRGTCLFLVPLRTAAGAGPGVSIRLRPATALLPLDYATVSFSGLRVPYHRWLRDGASISEDSSFHDPLGSPNARTTRSVSMSRFALGAVPSGLAAAARASVLIAIRHAQRRRTAGPFAARTPAISYSHQQRLLLTALAAAMAATALARQTAGPCWQIIGRGQGAGPAPGVLRQAALAKVAADQFAGRAIARCRAACGALGFFSENRLIDYEALAMAFTTAGGNNQVILLDAARAMVAGVDDATPDASLPGELPSGPSGWLGLLAARERHLHRELASRLRAAEARGAGQFDAWNGQSHLAQQLAEARAARLTLEAMLAEAETGVAAGQTAAWLDLCHLVFLDELASHDGSYLAAGLLNSAIVRSLPEQIDQTCARLMPHLAALTELLRVPEEIIRGPLAGPDYIAGLTQ
jgi:acyl-CoA oxidase